MNIEQRFLKYCIQNLDLKQPDDFDEYFSSVALCAFNAIFSINTRYEAVLNALERFCDHFKLQIQAPSKGRIPAIRSQKSVSEIYSLISDIGPKELSAKVFQNRQRTSTRNGILKADACIRFLKVLDDFGVKYYQDIPKIREDGAFDKCVKNIPGQKSGTSLKYFFMLTGSQNEIKPDQMVLGFIKDATGHTMDAQEALLLIRATVDSLKGMECTNLNARHLDNLIWNYQRGR